MGGTVDAATPARVTAPTRRRTPIAGGVSGAVVAIAATMVLWALMVWIVLRNAFATAHVYSVIAVGAYLVLATVLVFATSMQLLARLGAAIRFRRHAPAPLNLARARVHSRGSSLAVIVPSYREEPEVVFRTLLSAALLEYPGVRVVLLIDDPPLPENSEHRALLDSARKLPVIVERLLAPIRTEIEASYAQFCRGSEHRLAECLADAAAELRTWARFWTDDHGDQLFAETVLQHLVREFEHLASSPPRADADVHATYRILIDVFSARVTCFERKQYANLPHEANKAMNLNAYLGLMGGRFTVVDSELRPDSGGRRRDRRHRFRSYAGCRQRAASGLRAAVG